jgi:ATP-dependent Lhr-like helicase
MRTNLRSVEYVIIDEVHDLAESKRGAQLSLALERLVAYSGEFQRIGLSATVGNPEEIGRFLSGDREFSVVQVDVTKHLEITVEFAGNNFEQQAQWVSDTIDRHQSTLIFVNTRVTAEALGHQLYSRGDVEVHHGSLSKEVRIDAEERFKRGEVKTLICTSSMELGIDIGRVDHVISVWIPPGRRNLSPQPPLWRHGHEAPQAPGGAGPRSGNPPPPQAWPAGLRLSL